MNRIYRLVWNAAKGINQVASEKSRSLGKGKRGLKRPRLATFLLLSSPAAFAGGALPTGGAVVAGNGNIGSNGSTMTINQSTQKMAIDWQSFSIGSGNSVEFVQPSATSVALNRVLGPDASLIQGSLKANGQVFLLNPNGVLFSPTAQVNAGALVASTLNLKNEDFLAGRYAFEGSSSNAIINQGNITAAAGGGVALIAAKVTNTGSIDAQRGNALLGAGSKVTLDFGGPVKLQVEQGAIDALIANGGAIRADGGTVVMTAKAAGELTSTVINNTGLVQAQTLATGEKGTILLLGDMAHGRIEVGGTLDARATGKGDGGFIETSASEVNTASELVVNAGAAQGKGGLWLVDPYDYTVGATAAGNITTALNSGTSVTITTQSNNASYGATASGSGDITVSNAITKSSGGDATLTLQADRNIIVNNDITSTTGKLNLTLSAANAAGATRGGVDVEANLKSNGGDILIGGAIGTASNGIGYATNLNTTSAAVIIGQNKQVLSTGGSITINGKSTIGSSSGSYSGTTGGVYVKSGATVVSGSGNLYVTGESAGGTKTFGLGFEGNSGTVTTMGTSPGAGNMMINGVNTTSGATAAALDQGAVGLVSYGSRDRIVFQGPSVASWLVFVNGVAQLSGYTQAPQLSSCSVSYPNCGTMVVPGSNNSYLYATYQVVSMATNPLYVTQTGNGSKVYDGNTNATGLSFSTLGGPGGFTVGALSPAPLFMTSSKNVGTYNTLIANAANPNTYTSAGTSYAVGYFNTGSYSITPKALTPIASDKVYDGNTVAAVSATGLISGDSVTLSGTGTFASKNVGTYNNVGISGITLSGTDAGNYTLSGNAVSNATASITPRTVTLSATKVYDGSASFSSGVSIGNLVSGEDLQFSGATANNAHAGSASYLTALTLANGSNGSASNYQLPAMNAAGSSNAATITPKALTTSLANSSVTKEYDGTTTAPTGFTPSWTVTGLVSGDTAASISGSSAYDSAHVASASKVTVSGMTLGAVTGSNNSLASDYMLDTSSRFVAATITPKALTTSLSNSSVTKVYDGSTSAAGFTPGWNVSGFVSGDTAASISGSSAYDSAHVASASKVTVSGMTLSAITGNRGSQASDYSLDVSSRFVNASITARTLTASLNNTNVSKTYDGSDSAPAGFTPGWNVTGFASGDTAASISGTAAYDSAHAAAASKVTVSGMSIGTVTGSLGSQASDYALDASSKFVAATITPKALTTSLANSSVSKEYDGTTSAPTGFAPSWNVTGFVSGDTAASISGSSAFDSAHVASASKVTVSGMALGSITGNNNSLASDYALDASSRFVTATITPKALTTSLTNGSTTKVYDGTTSAPTGFAPGWNVSGFVSGDTAASISGISAYDNAHVASASKVTVSGMALSGITGSNGSQASDYALDVASRFVNASITPRTITASLNNAGATKTYDGTDGAPSGFTPNWNVTGFASGDTAASLSGTAAYDSAHAAAASKVTVSGMSIGAVTGSLGSQASDYALDASSKFVAATITPKALTTSLANSSVSKEYDGTTTAAMGFTPSWNVTGFVSGDTAASISGSSAYDSAHVASASKVTVSGMALGAVTGSNNSLASDYTLDTSSRFVTAVITPKALTTSLTNSSVTKVYDGSTSAAGFTPGWNVSGFVSGDTAASISGSSAYDSAHVASASKVTVSGMTLSAITGNRGSQASDYALDVSSRFVNASITARTLTASLNNTNVSKTYDGSDSAPAGFTPGWNVTGFASGDTAASISGTAAYDSAHAAAASKVTVSGMSIGAVTGSLGSQASDYALDTSSKFVAATITPKTLTATLANTGTTKVYDGSTSAPAGFTPQWNLGGFISSDSSATVSGTAAYDSAHVATASKVTVSGLAIGSVSGSHGSLASDYALDGSSKFTAATITPKSVTATLSNTSVSKTYDGTTAAPAGFTPAWNVSGLVSGDGGLNITTTGAAYDSSQAGTATRVTVNGMAIGSVRNSSHNSLASDYALTASSADVAAGIVAASVVTPAPAAVLPQQYTSVTPTLLPPAAGELTYVSAAGAGEMSYVSAPAPAAAVDGAAATTGARSSTTLNIVNRQRKVASQAATIGNAIKTLDVVVISDGIRIPANANANANPQNQGK